MNQSVSAYVHDVNPKHVCWHENRHEEGVDFWLDIGDIKIAVIGLELAEALAVAAAALRDRILELEKSEE